MTAEKDSTELTENQGQILVHLARATIAARLGLSDAGSSSIFFQYGHGILLPNAFRIPHVAAHFNSIGVAGFGQQFFGAFDVPLDWG